MKFVWSLHHTFVCSGSILSITFRNVKLLSTLLDQSVTFENWKCSFVCILHNHRLEIERFIAEAIDVWIKYE